LHTDMIKIPQSVLQIDNNVKHYWKVINK
jgi:hypothetical protein